MNLKIIFKITSLVLVFTSGLLIGGFFHYFQASKTISRDYTKSNEVQKLKSVGDNVLSSQTLSDNFVQNILNSKLELGLKVEQLQAVPQGSEVVFKGKLRTISTSGDIKFNFVDQNGEEIGNSNTNWFWAYLEPDSIELKKLFEIDNRRKVNYYEINGILEEYDCEYWDSVTPYYGTCQSVVKARSVNPVYLPN